MSRLFSVLCCRIKLNRTKKKLKKNLTKPLHRRYTRCYYMAAKQHCLKIKITFKKFRFYGSGDHKKKQTNPAITSSSSFCSLVIFSNFFSSLKSCLALWKTEKGWIFNPGSWRASSKDCIWTIVFCMGPTCSSITCQDRTEMMDVILSQKNQHHKFLLH